MHWGWKYDSVQLLRETTWTFLKTLDTELPHDLLIPLPSLHSNELKVVSHTGICTPMFMVALFTSQRVEASQLPTDGRMDAENVTCLYRVIFHSGSGKTAFGQRASGVPTHSRTTTTQHCTWHPGVPLANEAVTQRCTGLG